MGTQREVEEMTLAQSQGPNNLAQKSLSRRTVRRNEVIVNAHALDIGGYRMTVLRSQLPRKPQSSPEWRQALQLLARSPRGTIEDVLELGHGFSRETLATLVLNGLAMVMTETLSLGGATIKIERMRITDAGRRAIRG
jgi:hypothetical protein